MIMGTSTNYTVRRQDGVERVHQLQEDTMDPPSAVKVSVDALCGKEARYLEDDQ